MNVRHESIMKHATTSQGSMADYIVAAGCLVALLSGTAAVLAGLGSRWEWWHYTTGLSILRIAAYCGAGAAVVSLAGGIALRNEDHRGFMLAAAAGMLIGLLTAGVPWLWMQAAQELPRIHDITTDTGNPPVFLAVLPFRQDAPNSTEYEGAAVAAQQQAAYPDIKPLVLPLSPADAFKVALDTARGMGWMIVDENAPTGRIEATATTIWFGFKDDVVIRVSPHLEGSVIDVRSLSRVGLSDVGANAERIRAYLGAVTDSAS